MHFIFSKFIFKNHAIDDIMWKKMTLWSAHIVRWILKATNTLLEYVILSALLLQQWLHKCTSVLHDMYIAC